MITKSDYLEGLVCSLVIFTIGLIISVFLKNSISFFIFTGMIAGTINAMLNISLRKDYSK